MSIFITKIKLYNFRRFREFVIEPNTKNNKISISSLNKSIQTYNNLMGCQPYAKHRFR